MGRKGEGDGENSGPGPLTPLTMASVSIQHVSKSFGPTTAVDNVSLDIRSGEFFSILGPSGCGKTTLLRMIAGFESPGKGAILLDGKDITRTPAQFRGIGMVFQNYALFPHMTVFQNVAFGLQTHKVPPEAARVRVGEILESVGLSNKIDVPVPNLSGGEQQRVAVARALVVNPSVLLFDEPLSNLDVALRHRTREEIRALQRKTGTTTIYVTHDQAEAMSLSSRIAVMRSGHVEQIGTPADVYEIPGTRFVAEFLGGANLVQGQFSSSDRALIAAGVRFPVEQPVGMTEGTVVLAVKPEAIQLKMHSGQGYPSGTIMEKEYLGFVTNFLVDISGLSLRVSSTSSALTQSLAPGQKVEVHVDWGRCTVLHD